MKRIHKLTVFLPFIIGFLGVHSNLEDKEYARLITDIHHLYVTSSVLIICNDELETFNLNIMHRLSTNGIISQTSSIARLWRMQDRYAKQIKRQLFVVFLREEETIKPFENAIRNVTVSEPAWLIIFGPNLDDYCQNPHGNPFNLAFDTEMLVKCYNETTLREWYSIHANQTEMYDRGTWDPDNNLKLFKDDSLYMRRNNLGGISMRIVSVSKTNSLQSKGMRRYFGDLLVELARTLNFKLKVQNRTESYGIWDERAKKWTGLIGELWRKEADISDADMVMTNRRYGDIDFTIPLLTSRIVLCIKEPNVLGVQKLGYFKALDEFIWIIIMVFVLTTPIIWTLIRVKTSGHLKNLKIILCENYFDVWSIFCQQGLPEFPEVTSLRVVYFSIFLSALVVSSAYSAELISFLTVPSTVLPFTTLEGFVKNGKYKLIVLKHSLFYETLRMEKIPLYQEMYKLMKNYSDLPDNLTEAFNQVCSSRTALYVTENAVNSRQVRDNCTLKFIYSRSIVSLSMPISSKNQYKGIINFYLKRFIDSGVSNYLREKRQEMEYNHAETQYQIVTLSGVAPILKIVAAGAVLSVILFIAERKFNTYNERNYRGLQKESIWHRIRFIVHGIKAKNTDKFSKILSIINLRNRK